MLAEHGDYLVEKKGKLDVREERNIYGKEDIETQCERKIQTYINTIAVACDVVSVSYTHLLILNRCMSMQC